MTEYSVIAVPATAVARGRFNSPHRSNCPEAPAGAPAEATETVTDFDQNHSAAYCHSFRDLSPLRALVRE